MARFYAYSYNIEQIRRLSKQDTILYDIPLGPLEVIKKQVSPFSYSFNDQLRRTEAATRGLAKLTGGPKKDENLDNEEDNYRFSSQL
jgi:hypothetical protein